MHAVQPMLLKFKRFVTLQLVATELPPMLRRQNLNFAGVFKHTGVRDYETDFMCTETLILRFSET